MNSVSYHNRRLDPPRTLIESCRAALGVLAHRSNLSWAQAFFDPVAECLELSTQKLEDFYRDPAWDAVDQYWTRFDEIQATAWQLELWDRGADPAVFRIIRRGFPIEATEKRYDLGEYYFRVADDPIAAIVQGALVQENIGLSASVTTLIELIRRAKGLTVVVEGRRLELKRLHVYSRKGNLKVSVRVGEKGAATTSK